MKAMTRFSIRPGATREAVARFLAGDGAPVEGSKLLGRWFSVDLSEGFALYQTDDPVKLYHGAARWVELMEIKTLLVVEDAEAAPILATVFAGSPKV
jgi:hypothetical protein